jgi:GR25 family glycosyltransferase involved in LPS biosynthesis
MITYKKIVINLDRREDRLREFRNRFGSFSGDIERFSAIDGDFYVRENKLSPFERELFNFGNFHRSKNAEFGCWLSHYKCWELALEIKEDALIIFEDDAFPSVDFNKKFLEIIKNMNKEMPLIYIGGRSYENFSPSDMNPWVKNGIFYYYEKSFPYSGKNMDRTFHSYIITKSGAKILIDKLKSEISLGKKIAAVDGWVSYQRGELKSLDYFPHIVHSPVNYKSDIAKGRK